MINDWAIVLQREGQFEKGIAKELCKMEIDEIEATCRCWRPEAPTWESRLLNANMKLPHSLTYHLSIFVITLCYMCYSSFFATSSIAIL